MSQRVTECRERALKQIHDPLTLTGVSRTISEWSGTWVESERHQSISAEIVLALLVFWSSRHFLDSLLNLTEGHEGGLLERSYVYERLEFGGKILVEFNSKSPPSSIQVEAFGAFA